MKNISGINSDHIAAFQAAITGCPIGANQAFESLEKSIMRKAAQIKCQDEESCSPLLYVDTGTQLVSAYGALPWADLSGPFRAVIAMK